LLGTDRLTTNQRVRTDKTHSEHNESALGPIATKKACDRGMLRRLPSRYSRLVINRRSRWSLLFNARSIRSCQASLARSEKLLPNSRPATDLRQEIRVNSMASNRGDGDYLRSRPANLHSQKNRDRVIGNIPRNRLLVLPDAHHRSIARIGPPHQDKGAEQRDND
jgi:hypothetical protein